MHAARQSPARLKVRQPHRSSLQRNRALGERLAAGRGRKSCGHLQPAASKIRSPCDEKPASLGLDLGVVSAVHLGKNEGNLSSKAHTFISPTPEIPLSLQDG
ncbi:hypothetical protein CPSG_01767 [Coccidioides posadasii str. Silveira]|uniref:Uncharacterized protein n=1 Tax=Coccidioides posadasii (strain RMSCC 757 / Silveira) TaxID=443226 RepID=E9CWD4_COCPS|nr:hypothetical protein CPSG_01767 [Coccidioides posadasii str. Silveira]